MAEIHVYLDWVLRAVRAQPGDDPLGVFVREGQADPEVSDHDLVANLIVWSTFRPNMRGCERLRVRW